ncbi:MAG: FAD-binding protein [Oscillospiraceae bacterium]|nr:FAD-binding protein [Oscillospiraceae bacterium]
MSKKELSRRDFLKGAGAAAGVAALGMLAGCTNDSKPTPTPEGTPEAPKGIYTPGTYSAKGKGMSDLVVTMTFSADAITDVVLNLEGETADIGQAAAEELKAALMEKQGAEIDAVSGATLTSRGVMEAAKKCIQQAKGEIPVEVIGGDAAEGTAAGWLGTEPEVTNIAETWDTDILIVGAGNAGCAAGAFAAKNKLNFRLIEKMDSVGATRNWYAAVDSADAKALGEKPVDRARLRQELKRFSSGKCNQQAWTTWIEESADMQAFVKELYGIYAPDCKLTVTVGDEASWPEDEGFFFPAVEHTWSRGELARNQIFQKYMEDAGYSIDFGVSLVKLEKTGEKITGVIAKNESTGTYIRINAKNGVIIATGGYPANPEMMEQLDPLGTSVITYKYYAAQDDGQGIKAGVWAGGALQKEAAPMIFDRGIVTPGTDAGYVTLSTGGKAFGSTWPKNQFNLGTQPFLKVNRRGERFTNESGTYDMMSYSAANQPGGVYCSVFDAGMPEDVVRFHTVGCSASTRKNPEGQLKNFDEDNGFCFKADTLEELADKLGFTGKDKETFLATCARYNELYDQQRDDDYGKPAYKLSALKTAPFYGFWMGGALLTTEQGLLVDEKARVLNAETNEPMEGLFAAGDCSGGFFVNNYPCLLPGIACGRSMTFGIKAVKVAGGIDE